MYCVQVWGEDEVIWFWWVQSATEARAWKRMLYDSAPPYIAKPDVFVECTYMHH